MFDKVTASLPDIWAYLKQTDKPIYIYGMGDGADKMLSALDRFGIACAGFFASDGFVRGQVFHGQTVLSFGEVHERYGGDFIALMAFGSRRPEVIDYVRGIASMCEFYVPELPVTGDILFTADFYAAHKAEHDEVRAMLCDELSVRVFDEMIRYRLTGNLDILLAGHMSTHEDEALALIGADKVSTYMDLGAYTGDTIRELIRFKSEQGAEPLRKIRALEPERHSHKKLSEYLTTLDGIDARAHQACASDRNGSVQFTSGRGRGSRTGKGTEVACMTPDSLCTDTFIPDYINYDVEGAEHAAINGTADTLAAHAPALNVALYHRPEDIFDLPLLVKRINGQYKLYMRRHGGIPGWDLNLYCVNIQRSNK